MDMTNNMNYLLDTHVVLWWFTDPTIIKSKTRHIIQDKSNGIFISSASFWEMAIKKSIGKLTLPHNFLEALTMEGFQTLTIKPEEALGVADLPMLHTDPFERLLIIQAKLNNLILITRDSKIQNYPVPTLMA